MSACQPIVSKSKYEVVSVESSDDDDESKLFINSSPRQRQQYYNPVQAHAFPVFGVAGPGPAQGSTRKLPSKTKTVKDVFQSQQLPDSKTKQKNSSSVRVRPEKKKKPLAKIRLPKHLPTDSEFVFDRRSRREAQQHSKVLSLTTAEKDTLISQRINQVMGEVMDKKDSTVMEKYRFHTQEVPLGINQRLGAFIEKDSPFWARSHQDDDSQSFKEVSDGETKYEQAMEDSLLDLLPQDEAVSVSPIKVITKNTFGGGKVQESWDDSLLDLLPPDEFMAISPVKIVGKETNTGTIARGRSGSLSPPRHRSTSPPMSDVSPMLNYSIIDTPILKAELKRYGLKPFPRSKAKKLLRHIYNETHSKQ